MPSDWERSRRKPAAVMWLMNQRASLVKALQLLLLLLLTQGRYSPPPTHPSMRLWPAIWFQPRKLSQRVHVKLARVLPGEKRTKRFKWVARVLVSCLTSVSEW